jgi:hypothetical protein
MLDDRNTVHPGFKFSHWELKVVSILFALLSFFLLLGRADSN